MPVGLFRMRDEHGEDDKILLVPSGDPNWNYMEKLDDVPRQLRGEIEHFFSVYKQPEGKHVEVDGWYPLEEALVVLDQARQRYREQFPAS